MFALGVVLTLALIAQAVWDSSVAGWISLGAVTVLALVRLLRPGLPAGGDGDADFDFGD
jgi:hypothetical protein